MFNSKINENFIVEIRGVHPSLSSARVSLIKISKEERTIEYTFISDQPVLEEAQKLLSKKLVELTPKVFTTVKFAVKKIATDPVLVSREIYNFLEKNYRSISIFLKPTDISSSVKEDGASFVLRLTPDGCEYVRKNGILAEVCNHLATVFCSDFKGNVEEKDLEDIIDLADDTVFLEEIERAEHRTIKVKSVYIIDDLSIGDTALYIEDAISGSFVVCGNITEIVERETKNKKPYFIIRIDDTTGTIGGVYFSKKNTLDKIRRFKEGDSIIARATIGEYNGRKSLTFEKINGCEFPTDFVKKEKYKKPVPNDYKLIFPKPSEIIKVASVFDMGLDLPNELVENEYVVFDIETTGTDLMSNGITEIGAVKIKQGKICEEWTTLVKPDYAISKEITELTGITEEMVKDSPKIGMVIPDFIKFISGTTIVAHNAEFDVKFMKRFAGAEDYAISNKVLDTVALTRKYLPGLKHADLKTVANHFGVEFRHHRALSDAYATAEVFIELMKIKSKV